MAYVMVYQRSVVMTTSVKTDSSVAKTVRNPATWQPRPTRSFVYNARIYIDCSSFFFSILEHKHFFKINNEPSSDVKTDKT